MKNSFLAFIIVALSIFPAFAEEIDLNLYEKSLYSQNGEDGILAQIFQVMPPKLRYCVELGAYDGITGSNTYLLRAQKWRGLLMDRAFEAPEYNLRREFIIAENINDLFERYNVEPDLDLLSINIDYNDFYIWKSLSEKYKPAVVVIAYNATHLPHEDKVTKYRPFFCGDGTNYFGASLLAFYNLARSKGYSLVYADKNGASLFFIRDDLIEELNLQFKDINDVEKLYRKPTRGRPKDLKDRPYFSSMELINPKK